MHMCASLRQHMVRDYITLILIVLYFSRPAFADEGKFTIGDKLPEFSNLTAVDGTKWNSGKLGDSRVLIIAFTCNGCPYAVDYEDRLNVLHEKYRKSAKQVKIFVINSSFGPDDSLENMQIRAKEKRFRFPYVKDKDQSVAGRLGAVFTPEFFVFDQDRKLAYKGALDDSTDAEEVKTHYVNDAVSSLLAGTPVKTTEVGARGCTIRFKRRRADGRDR